MAVEAEEMPTAPVRRQSPVINGLSSDVLTFGGRIREPKVTGPSDSGRKTLKLVRTAKTIYYLLDMK